MDLSDIPPSVLAVALAYRDGQEPSLDDHWLVKLRFVVHLPTLHVVERQTGAVRQGSISLTKQASPRGERVYKTVAFSLGGNACRIHLGRVR